MCKKLIYLISFSFVLGLVSSASVVSADTIAYWRFDDVGDSVIDVPAGTVAPGNQLPNSDSWTVWRKAAHDHSGNGNHLTTWNAPWAGHIWSSDVPAATVPLNGTSNALSIVNSGNFPCVMTWSDESHPSGIDLESIEPAEFTIEISFKLTQLTIPGDFWLEHITLLGRDGMNVVDDNPGLAPLNLGVWPGDTLIVRFGDVAGYNHVAESAPGAVTTDQWYNLVVVSDGSTLSLYLNTGLVAQTDLTASGSTNTALAIGTGSGGDWQAATWTIGRGMRNGLHTDRVFGYIDEVRISNSALTRSEFLFLSGYSAVMNPLDGATDVAWDSTLSWLPGAYATAHDVYFGTDINDVNNADVTDNTDIYRGSQVLDDTSYTPTETPLQWGQRYYWRVDEVNDAEPSSPWKGEVWSFTTVNFIVVDDFEDYNDYEPYTIYLTWIDGWGDATNGSSAGYPEPIFYLGQHYMETTIIHGGSQSMPLFYDNTTAGLSEVTKTMNDDWTRDDVITLTLFYYGDAGNAMEPMYVALNDDAVVTNDDPRAVLDNEWNRWDILLQDFADQGVDLTNVETMSIGMGDKANPVASGSTGHVFFDDIRLYRSPPEEPEPEPESVNPGTDNLVAYYAFENNTEDGSGNGLHGTTVGNPQYVSGPTGYGIAMEFDSTLDHVELPIGSVIAETNDITVSCWVDFSNLGGGWQRIWDFGSGEDNYMFVTPRLGTNGQLRFAISTGTETNITAPATLPSSWHHIAASIDSTSMTMKLYQDGRLVAEGETPLLPSDLGETNQNYLARSQFAADAFYFGSIDEFKIYNRALSMPEVLYLAGK